MVTITDIRSVNYAEYDEVWAVVRSLKNPGRMGHVPALSPSWELFRKYLRLRDTGQWNEASFQEIYVPVFLKEMQFESARRKLNELVWLDRNGKRICLVCFCPDETLCHRSILAGMLQHVGTSVQGVTGDYSRYGLAYFEERMQK